MLIDSHTHLNDPAFHADMGDVLARMQEAGVSGALVVGYDMPSSRQAVELARLHPNMLRAAVGMHPHDSKDLDTEALAVLGELARLPEVVAYGEIGLDYHYDHSPRDMQREAFRRQLALAAECTLPVIIHEREAAEDVMAIMDEGGGWACGGSWHCCSVEVGLAEVIARSLFIGIAGWITFPKAENIRALARALPLERLLVETDCPYITPVPHRGKRNEPAFVRLTVQALAEVKGITLEDVESVTSENVPRAFPRWNQEG
ncbi:MAG: TatD family hydrolase [Armatimonadota bacterium]